MAARYTLDRSTRLLCNPSSLEMLKTLAGPSLNIQGITENDVDLMSYKSDHMGWIRIKVRAITTDHEEIGIVGSTSKAILISCDSGRDRNSMTNTDELVILGDTEYRRFDNKQSFMSFVIGHNKRVVVLHIGCSQQKSRTGKHLYFTGLRKILLDMDSELETIGYQGKLCVLVSEWGLEHATQSQINEICDRNLQSFNNDSPIVDVINLLKDGLTKIELIPADIGLTIGINSGKIYLENDMQIEAQSLRWETSGSGLIYYSA